jgi:hypothetical protein
MTSAMHSRPDTGPAPVQLAFGNQVYDRALALAEQGKDANQIAKVLCDQDPEGYNYGIGVILGGDGKPAATSSTLLEYTVAELQRCDRGGYANSAVLMEEVKQAALAWQRVPGEYWDRFTLALPSDAGTGAVMSAVEAALILSPGLDTLGVEELGWPAYKTIARVVRVQYREHPEDAVIGGEGVLPVYQSGPMNTTGRVRGPEVIRSRAEAAAQSGVPVVLDRAYAGFEFARLLASHGYDEVMRRSYELQLRPFIETGARFCLAASPTKAFVTFSLRPSGLLLVYEPDAARRNEVANVLGAIIRARGSSFEHPVTRAFAKAMAQDLVRFEGEHAESMRRVADAEEQWRALVRGTPIEPLFSEEYAGLFRNPQARKGAAARIYDQHIYPVFSGDRCRQNVTGIPEDEELARKHVAVFAAECFQST